MGSISEYKGRELRKPDGTANKVIFTRQYPGKEALSFLLVEGETDGYFYESFIDSNKCEIVVAHSKYSAVEVLTILTAAQIQGILAIVDADFDVLQGSPQVQNVLFTDTHDVETMILKSPALEKVLREFGSREKIERIVHDTTKDIRTILLECGSPIGYLRWASLRESLNLNFDGLDFAQFVTALNLHQLKFIRTVKNKSQRHDLLDSQIDVTLNNTRDDSHDLWHVCCGHDLVCILSVGLRGTIGSCQANDVKSEILERSLRLAFDSSHFIVTKLYASIKDWEISNPPFTILSM